MDSEIELAWNPTHALPPIPTSELVGRRVLPSPPLLKDCDDESTFKTVCSTYLQTVRAIRPHQYKCSMYRLNAQLDKLRTCVLNGATVLKNNSCSVGVFVCYLHRQREVLLQDKRDGQGAGSPIVPPQVAFSERSLQHVTAAVTYGSTRYNNRVQPMNEAHAKLIATRQLALLHMARAPETEHAAIVSKYLSRGTWLHLIQLSRELYSAELAEFNARVAKNEWVWSSLPTTQSTATNKGAQWHK